MSNQDLIKMFRPGDGGLPPYLIVYGPRGNGKTVLLRYLQMETRARLGNLTAGDTRKLRDKVFHAEPL